MTLPASTTGGGRIVFALDVPSVAEARAHAEALRGQIGMLKVGLELFVEAGPEGVRALAASGTPIFLDLKLHDIPATVERAVDRALALGARVLTVHASGGAEMLARAARKAEGTPLLVTAVTVLTSLDEADLRAQAIATSVADHALRLGQLAFDQGVRGFVCSPHEVHALRAALGAEATFFTPGVRPARSARTDDQKRVATCGEAIRDGADYVVIGRPLRDAADPSAAAELIAHEIDDALRARGASRAHRSTTSP